MKPRVSTFLKENLNSEPPQDNPDSYLDIIAERSCVFIPALNVPELG